MLPRRGSLTGDSSTAKCIVADCNAQGIRRGGYCVDHHKSLASPSAIPENKVPEMVCLGHTCQGLIENGYCQRHRQLAGAGDIQTLSPLSPPLQGIKNKKKKPSLVQEQLQGGNRERGQEILEQFLESLHAISTQTELHLAAEEIIKQTCLILMAERATIFYVDEDELVLMIAKGAKNIRLPKSQGIAGWVATEGQMINIIDAYAEKKFDSSIDKSTGFRTRNILAAPIVDQAGKVIAVLQVINKIIGSFTKSDEVLLENMAFHCSVVLRNAQQYEASRRSEQKVLALLEMVTMLHSQQSSSASLIFTLSNRSHTLVNADRATLYLCDTSKDQLVVMTGDVDIRIPLTKGIAGHVASTGKIVNIPDCYKDDRFNPAVDKQTGYRTKSMLCMPIPAGDGEVIGVLQLINRLDENQFTSEDEQILTTLLSIAGPILKKTNVFAQKEKQSPREVPIPTSQGPPTKNKNRFTPSLLPISKIQENNDD